MIKLYNEKMKKLISIVVSLTLLIGMVSCGKRGDDIAKARKVSADGEWWNENITEISIDDIKKELNVTPMQISNRYFAADEDSFVVSLLVYDQDMRVNSLLRHYSYEGELMGQVNIGECFANEDESYDPRIVYKKGDKYYTFINHYDKEIDSFISSGYEIDFDAGTLKNSFELELPSDGNGRAELSELIVVGNKLVCIGSKLNKEWSFSYEIYVIDGNDTCTYIPNFGNDAEVHYINHLSYSGDTVSFVAAISKNGLEKTLYCSLDIESFNLQTIESERTIEMAQFVPGCGMFDTTDMRTVSRIDPSTGEKSVLLDFSDTYINGQYMVYADGVVWATDDKVVLLTNENDPLSRRVSPLSIILLTKAETNPNAGKAILSIASLDHMTDQEFYAVNDFNRHSEKYFIEIENKYYDVAMNGWNSLEWEAEHDLSTIMKYETDAVTLLMSDIREGKGPDLVIYTNEYGQLDDTDYLIDLTKRIESERSLYNGDYMDFIIQPNGRDGNHYRLDYGFSFDGFVIKNTLIDDGMQGLTFEQYDQIINEYNQGVNILPEDDLAMMRTLIKSSDYLAFNKDGKLSLDTDGFRRMTNYISSIPDGTVFDNDYKGTINQIQYYASNFRSYALAYRQVYSNFSIIGLPSSDGHAETIKGRGIGITSCSLLPDAAWSFVMKMLTPEVQYWSSIYDPVLLSAQRIVFNDYVEARNSEANPRLYEYPIPEDIVDMYIQQISDAIVVPDIDSSILIVFNEEMPAYFEGQKSLDEVIKIIESRVNLMLSERG